MDVSHLSKYYPEVDFSQVGPEQTTGVNNVRCLGTRVLVGPVIVDDFGSVIDRMVPELNLEPDVSLAELPEDDPWQEIIKGVFTGFFRIFLQIQSSGQTSLEKINSCVRLDIAVSSSPNFDSCGRISQIAKNFLRSTFPDQPLPIVATTGVNALPRKSVLLMVAEFDAI